MRLIEAYDINPYQQGKGFSMSLHSNDASIVRYIAVSRVFSQVAGGMSLPLAVQTVAKEHIFDLNGRSIRVSSRTLYRWVRAFEKKGLSGLSSESRLMSGASKALSSKFIDYLVQEKNKDPDASLPEIIRRADLDGVIEGKVSRSSTWRAARRLNLPIFAEKSDTASDKRRFSYAHRLQMVLTDGKHFRAGAKRRRRVVMTFLDDATRFALCAAVGTTEHTELFTRGLWTCVSRWGLFSSLYLDNGPAFISSDTIIIVARLEIALIHGTADYPEGRGKVERFHRTLQEDLLRTFDANPEIDPDTAALELRINHYLQNMYNRHPHESLDGDTPEKRFLEDSLALRVNHDLNVLRQHFVLKSSRKVSHDNIVKVDGILFETPIGYAGRRIEVFRHSLDHTVSIVHEGKCFLLKPVDPILNAHSVRARKDPDRPRPRPTRSAASKMFYRDLSPIVTNTGDFPEKE